MTTTRPTLALLLLGLCAVPARAEPLPNGINGVWGDASWELRYGRAPTLGDDSGERVRVHLEEVLTRLKDADTSALPAAVRARRADALVVLGAYIATGAYPRNLDTPHPRPDLIDQDGHLCAVGAMVASTAGLDALERLDLRYDRDSVWAIDDPGLAAWARHHGFSETELALIQPTYDIVIKVRVLFAHAHTTLPTDAAATLDSFAEALQSNPHVRRVEVGGHASKREGRFAQRRSEKRAETVRRALIARGVAPERLVAVGHGTRRPTTDGATPQDRALNRRVELTVLDPPPIERDRRP